MPLPHPGDLPARRGQRLSAPLRSLWHHRSVTADQGMPNLLGALARARSAVDDHISLAEEFGSSWREETASEILWVRAAPFVRYADFTRHEESAIGADWLWWWVDASDCAFGMLVQAKRVHRSGNDLLLDLRAKGGAQMRALFHSAALIGVPAAYIVYFGDLKRREEVCRSAHETTCRRCPQLGVAVFPALEAHLAAMSPSQRESPYLN